MPDPQTHPQFAQIRRVARIALLAGVAITTLKFTAFALTDSAVVLTDAIESIINIVAAGFMLYSVWLSNRPADRDHPYGHGKVEYMAVGLEGWMILVAGLVIVYEAVRRFIRPSERLNVELGMYLLIPIAIASAVLAAYVWRAGRRYDSPTLVADGKHLATDACSTLGGIAALFLVHITGKAWIDPLASLVMAAIILYTSWRLLWQSSAGLMDRIDPADDQAIRKTLDDEVRTGAIRGYHKVRHRRSGNFLWVDMHLLVDPALSVVQGHEIASRIEHRIEEQMGRANATAHVEPMDESQVNEARE